jgi:hypothetical protein
MPENLCSSGRSCHLAFAADCRGVERRDSEDLITPRFGEQGGHIVSTAILCAAIILVA